MARFFQSSAPETHITRTTGPHHEDDGRERAIDADAECERFFFGGLLGPASPSPSSSAPDNKFLIFAWSGNTEALAPASAVALAPDALAPDALASEPTAAAAEPAAACVGSDCVFAGSICCCCGAAARAVCCCCCCSMGWFVGAACIGDIDALVKLCCNCCACACAGGRELGG